MYNRLVAQDCPFYIQLICVLIRHPSNREAKQCQGPIRELHTDSGSSTRKKNQGLQEKFDTGRQHSSFQSKENTDASKISFDCYELKNKSLGGANKRQKIYTKHGALTNTSIHVYSRLEREKERERES